MAKPPPIPPQAQPGRTTRPQGGGLARPPEERPRRESDDDLSSDVFIREVDEDLREEKMQALWKRHGWVLITVCALIVLVVAGRQIWTGLEESARMETAEAYDQAITLAETGKPADAAGALAGLAEDAPPGMAVLARLKRADLLAQSGDRQAAATVLDQLAADDRVDAFYRELAALLAVMHRLDAGDPAALRRTLEPLAVAGRPWRPFAMELDAALALRQGQEGQARETLERLVNDSATPISMRQRASLLLSRLPPAAPAAQHNTPAPTDGATPTEDKG